MNAANEIKPFASKRSTGISPATTNLNIHFAAAPPIRLPIKYAMKFSALIEHKPTVSSQGRTATHPGDFASTALKSAPSQTPLVELAAHPEKLEAALKIAKSENDAFDATCAFEKTEFHLEAPFASSVKLAADFTDWKQFPLDMARSQDGVWRAAVPLPPGHYSYRFIVDGEWCDDPHPAQRVPNPFGTVNAVVNVSRT